MGVVTGGLAAAIALALGHGIASAAGRRPFYWPGSGGRRDINLPDLFLTKSLYFVA